MCKFYYRGLDINNWVKPWTSTRLFNIYLNLNQCSEIVHEWVTLRSELVFTNCNFQIRSHSIHGYLFRPLFPESDFIWRTILVRWHRVIAIKLVGKAWLWWVEFLFLHAIVIGLSCGDKHPCVVSSSVRFVQPSSQWNYHREKCTSRLVFIALNCTIVHVRSQVTNAFCLDEPGTTEDILQSSMKSELASRTRAKRSRDRSGSLSGRLEEFSLVTFQKWQCGVLWRHNSYASRWGVSKLPCDVAFMKYLLLTLTFPNYYNILWHFGYIIHAMLCYCIQCFSAFFG